MYDLVNDFICEVFGEDEYEDARMVIMTRMEGPGRAPAHQFFSNPLEAVEYAAGISDRHVYFGLSLFHPGSSSRKMDSVVGIACFGIDIDVAGPNHKRTNLCPTKQDATELLKNAVPGCQPTIIIDSGNGIQGFFVFKEPIRFESPEDRAEAYAMAKALHKTVGFAAGKHGWHVDSTFDLARVMRLPGTMNVKDPADPKLVTIIEQSGQKYASLDDFQGVIVEEADVTEAYDRLSFSKTFHSQEMGLALNKDACVNQDKLEELCEAEVRFRAAWERRRPPGRPKPGKDPDLSLSSLDMTLANYAARYHWTDQEIADLLIHFRRRHADKPGDITKVIRTNYLERTIKKAREDCESYDRDEKTTRKWAETANKVKAIRAAGKELDPESTAVLEAKQCLSEYFQFPIEKVRKYQGSAPTYSIVTDTGREIVLGPSTTIANQHNLYCRILDAMTLGLTKVKGTHFTNIVNAMMSVAEEVETSEEAHDDGLMAKRIRDYWASSNIATNKNDGFKRRSPFAHEGRAYIFGEQFRKHIKAMEDEKIHARTTGMMFRILGCTNEKMHFEIFDSRGKTTTNTSVYDITNLVGEQPEQVDEES